MAALAAMAFVLVPSLSLNALYDARIQLDAKMRQPVPGARAGPVSLDRYMQLPVEQYRSLVKLVVPAAVESDADGSRRPSRWRSGPLGFKAEHGPRGPTAWPWSLSESPRRRPRRRFHSV